MERVPRHPDTRRQGSLEGLKLTSRVRGICRVQHRPACLLEQWGDLVEIRLEGIDGGLRRVQPQAIH
jgi:hypothetical protein